MWTELCEYTFRCESAARTWLKLTSDPSPPRPKVTRLIPMRRNNNFTGRTEVLKKLRETCFPNHEGVNSGDAVALVGLGGLGGIGKTQIALEFSYWVQDNMPECSIYWISALSMDTFSQSCSEILAQVGLPSRSQDGGQDDKKRLKDYLSTNSEAGKWLVVVDNTDDVSLVRAVRHYLPSSENGITLVTTRTEDAAFELTSSPSLISIEIMSEDEGLQLLKRSLQPKRVADYGDELCRQLVLALDMLPLAITQAAAYLNRSWITIRHYLELLHSREEEAIRLLSFEASSASEWPVEKQQQKQYHAAMTTWLVSLDQMRANEGDEDLSASPMVELLMFLSRIEPKAIPKRMLPEIGGSGAVLINTIGTLLSYSIVTKRESDVYDMHSLVHLAIRSWVSGQGLVDEAMTLAVNCLKGKMKFKDYYDSSSRVAWTEYLPHSLRVLTDSDGVQSGNRAWLANSVAFCLRADGRNKDALKWGVVYAEGIGAVYGRDSDYHTYSQCVVGFLYLNVGRSEAALSLLEAGIAVFQKTRRADDEDLVWAQLMHGRALYQTGHKRRAVKVLGKLANTLDIRHELWAAAHIKLADAHLDNNEDERAIDILEHVLDAPHDILPSDDHQRVSAEYSLACAYLRTDKADQALPLLKHVLAVWETQYPPHHINLLLAHQAQARAFLDIDQPTEALPILQHVIELQTKTLPPDHKVRLRTQYYYAQVLLATAQPHHAVSILEQNINLLPRTTLTDLHSVTMDMRVLRDVYEALDDPDNIERLDAMLEDVDNSIAEQRKHDHENSDQDTRDQTSPDEEQSDGAQSVEPLPAGERYTLEPHGECRPAPAADDSVPRAGRRWWNNTSQSLRQTRGDKPATEGWSTKRMHQKETIFSRTKEEYRHDAQTRGDATPKLRTRDKIKALFR